MVVNTVRHRDGRGARHTGREARMPRVFKCRATPQARMQRPANAVGFANRSNQGGRHLIDGFTGKDQMHRAFPNRQKHAG